MADEQIYRSFPATLSLDQDGEEHPQPSNAVAICGIQPKDHRHSPDFPDCGTVGMRHRLRETRQSGKMLRRSIAYTRTATPALMAAVMRITPLEFELICCSVKEASSLLANTTRRVAKLGRATQLQAGGTSARYA
ncbi:hypothetical protein [Sphingomonas glacialis]|uniref:Uncharacterized protein n=1 Tax=Sphingomonas glacialis TaxID=658225 RepID=A0A502G6P9_9SPHN|nr:hypothetical protein [Sphingomonas glacialis]TPG56543.1 hypothetical protein EAH76_03140 [Sphingomonas glacialis]